MNYGFEASPIPRWLQFQFKNGKLAWVRADRLEGLRLGIAYDYALGCDVWYQL